VIDAVGEAGFAGQIAPPVIFTVEAEDVSGQFQVGRVDADPVPAAA